MMRIKLYFAVFLLNIKNYYKDNLQRGFIAQTFFVSDLPCPPIDAPICQFHPDQSLMPLSSVQLMGWHKFLLSQNWNGRVSRLSSQWGHRPCINQRLSNASACADNSFPAYREHFHVQFLHIFLQSVPHSSQTSSCAFREPSYKTGTHPGWDSFPWNDATYSLR